MNTSKFPPSDNDFNHLDYDSNVSKIVAPNYIRAFNVTQIDDSGSEMRMVKIVRGNREICHLNPIALQNKTYRVSGWSNDEVTIHTLGFELGGLYEETFIEGATLEASMNNAIAAMEIAISNVGTYTITPSATFDYFDVLFTDSNWIEYYIYFDGTESLVLTEAIGIGMNGNNMVIGSKFQNGELFIWTTPHMDMPSSLNGTSVNNGGLIEVILLGDHNLVTGQKVKITGGLAAANVNGIWTVDVLTSNTFTLRYSTYVQSTDLTATFNFESVGQISVVTYNPDTETYSCIRLIASKAFDFRIWKQCDVDIDKDSRKVSLYWTDDYNVPRYMYYYGAYMTDGFLTYINSLNTYAYQTLAEETKLFLSNINLDISFFYQNTSGGNTYAGNWRYGVQLVTESGGRTEISGLTNPVNNYFESQNSYARNIIGSDAFVRTPKINEIKIAGITPSIFRYIELIGVNYQNGAITAYRIKRVALSDNPTQYIQHTGNEIETEVIPLGLLSEIPINYNKAKNLRIMDRRLVLSNLEAHEDPDLSSWALDIEYAVKKDIELDSVGNVVNGITYGEYQDPFNVNLKIGYMDNEVYRFGIRLGYKGSAVWTKVYFIVDAYIGTAAMFPLGGQRIGGLSDYDLTTAGDSPKPLPRYVQFSNLDFSYKTTDGRVISDIFDRCEFVRAEVIQPDIYFSGMVRLGKRETIPSIIRFFNVSGTTAYATLPAGYTNYRKGLLFNSPDIFLGKNALSLDSFVILNYGSPYSAIQVNTVAPYPTDLREYTGDMNAQTVPESITITTSENIENIGQGGAAAMGGGVVFNLDNSVGAFENSASIGIRTATDLTNVSTRTDYGFYYVQILKANFGKYGNPEDTQYISCGQTFDLTGTTATTYDIFGGDTFIQKTFYHNDYKTNNITGEGHGVSFYSQNRINSQMRFIVPLTGTTTYFPYVENQSQSVPDAQSNWLFDRLEDLYYNHGYDADKHLQFLAPYDSVRPDDVDFPVRFVWSDIKVSASGSDSFRKFLIAAFRDLDLKYGEIITHEVFNGELYSLQPSNRERQFFNTTNILQTQNGSDVILGDAGVMSRDGINLSSYGCSNKWSCIKGRSAGADTWYYIDVLKKVVCRVANDGTRIISMRHMESFFNKNLAWVLRHDTPSAGLGITGIWDEKRKEARWTVRGKRGLSDFVIDSGYEAGTAVNYEGEIYLARIQVPAEILPTNTTYWEFIEHTDNRYYNEYTIAYSELKNAFTVFYSGLPKAYMEWMNTFITQRPEDSENINEGSKLFIDGEGDFGVFYDDGVTAIKQDGYIEWVFNPDLNITKEYLALWFYSDIAPERIELTTATHTSYLTKDDFEQQNEQWYSVIKNDTLGSPTSVNDGDTSNLFGQYIRVKFIFKYEVDQYLAESVLKFFSLSRNYMK